MGKIPTLIAFYKLFISHIKIKMLQGPNLETKIASQKKTSVERKITRHRLKNVLGFAKCFSEFAKGIYEICNRNLFNLAIIVAVFSIVQFILCLRFAINN